jgi:hypothetical protein
MAHYDRKGGSSFRQTIRKNGNTTSELSDGATPANSSTTEVFLERRSLLAMVKRLIRAPYRRYIVTGVMKKISLKN